MAAEPGAAQTLRECRNAARLNDTKSEGEENGNSKAEKGEAEHQEASTCQDQVNADDSKVCLMSTSRTIQGNVWAKKTGCHTRRADSSCSRVRETGG